MDSGNLIEKMSSEIFDIIQAPLETIYGLEVMQPRLSLFSSKEWLGRNMTGVAGYFDDCGKEGTIGMSKELCKGKSSCAITYSHELGHAVAWQHNPGYYGLSNNIPLFNPMDSLMKMALGEGIASDYGYRGLEILTIAGYLWAPLAAIEASAAWLNEWLQPRYDIGRKIVKHFGKRGVSVKRLILEPEEFYDEMSGVFAAEIRKAYNFMFMNLLGF